MIMMPFIICIAIQKYTLIFLGRFEWWSSKWWIRWFLFVQGNALQIHESLLMAIITNRSCFQHSLHSNSACNMYFVWCFLFVAWRIHGHRMRNHKALGSLNGWFYLCIQKTWMFMSHYYGFLLPFVVSAKTPESKESINSNQRNKPPEKRH